MAAPIVSFMFSAVYFVILGVVLLNCLMLDAPVDMGVAVNVAIMLLVNLWSVATLYLRHIGKGN